jgi:hypothetical protein
MEVDIIEPMASVEDVESPENSVSLSEAEASWLKTLQVASCSNVEMFKC